RKVSPGGETSTILDGMEAGLAGATGALARLAEALQQQAEQMRASINGTEATLAAGIARGAHRIYQRESAAHEPLDAALAAMR
ncbi:hypothetical protein J8J40_32555, partial [Mycobacterium tuberculosis]|nr:hypothetical protein [Mycobacterium tuberculosis]